MRINVIKSINSLSVISTNISNRLVIFALNGIPHFDWAKLLFSVKTAPASAKIPLLSLVEILS